MKAVVKSGAIRVRIVGPDGAGDGRVWRYDAGKTLPNVRGGGVPVSDSVALVDMSDRVWERIGLLASDSCDRVGVAVVPRGSESATVEVREQGVRVRGTIVRPHEDVGTTVDVYLFGQVGSMAGPIGEVCLATADESFEFPPLPQAWFAAVSHLMARLSNGKECCVRFAERESDVRRRELVPSVRELRNWRTVWRRRAAEERLTVDGPFTYE